MRKWKISFFIVLLLLVVSNLYWAFTVVDTAIPYSYQKASLNSKHQSVEMLGALIVEGGKKYTKKDILHILRKNNKNAFIVEKESLISVEGVKFIFKNGVLSKVVG